MIQIVGTLILLALAQAPPSACDINRDGAVNVADIQTEINVVLGTALCPTPSSPGTATTVTLQAGSYQVGPGIIVIGNSIQLDSAWLNTYYTHK